MLKNIIVLFISIFINSIFSYTSVANSQKIEKNVICKEKNLFRDFLKDNQNEKLVWFGTAEDGSSVTELYESEISKKWTILEINTNGIACATIGGSVSTFLK